MVLGKMSGNLPMANGETVLFADDEASIRELGQEFLERLGYRVLMAVDSADAVQVYAENHEKIDILVLDVTMPKLSGEGMLKKIFEVNPEAKVVITSGYTAEGSPDPLLKMGAKKFLPKPYTIIPLGRALRSVLD